MPKISPSLATPFPDRLLTYPARQCLYSSAATTITTTVSATQPNRQPPHLLLRATSPTTAMGTILTEKNCNGKTTSGKTLKIAIVGFGTYGQFLSKTLVSQGHAVIAFSRSDYTRIAESLGVTFFHDINDLCIENPDVVVLCTSIISTETVLRSLPMEKLKRETLFVDVLSVKEFAKSLLIEVLPSEFDIICCHPMFGPQSGKNGWKDLDFVFEKVRISKEEHRVHTSDRFLEVFSSEGCRMKEMSCEEHDKYAAESQFITHTVGRVLDMLSLSSTQINTKGYESLLDLVANTVGDSFDLYYGLFLYNKNALEMLQRLDMAFESLRNELFGRLHLAVRKKLFNGGKIRVSMQSSDHLPSTTMQRLKQGDCVREACGIKFEGNDCKGNVSKLKIAIIGFGKFGQFLARTFIKQDHTVLAYSRSNYSHTASMLGATYFDDPHILFDQNPDVILLCTSILSVQNVLRSLPIHKLEPNTLFVDVSSVKEFPKSLLLQNLPPSHGILCTHPMFGPESGKGGWTGLPFVFDKVRVRGGSTCAKFLDIFALEGCRMVEMSCEEHDRHAAGSQFITHTVGRILEKLGLESTPINTKGYETLLNLVENTARDSFDLYYGLFVYNPNAMEQLERLEHAFASLKKQLFGSLHNALHEELL